jgi:hypothetical protein
MNISWARACQLRIALVALYPELHIKRIRRATGGPCLGDQPVECVQDCFSLGNGGSTVRATGFALSGRRLHERCMNRYALALIVTVIVLPAFVVAQTNPAGVAGTTMAATARASHRR